MIGVEIQSKGQQLVGQSLQVVACARVCPQCCRSLNGTESQRRPLTALCSLWLTTTPGWGHGAASSTRYEATTSCILGEATSPLTAWTVLVAATATTYPTSASEVAPISVRSRATLLHIYLFSTDTMGVGSHSRIVGCLVFEFDESAILSRDQYYETR